MNQFIQQIFSLVIEPPGNLAYHLVVAFALTAALQAAANFWRQSPRAEAKRMLAGLAFLLLLQVAQFGAAAAAWLGLFDPHQLLPPLERAIFLIGVVVLAWLWLLPEPRRLGDIASLLLGLLIITTFIFSLVWWTSQPAGQTFNGSFPDLAAQVLSIGLIAVVSLVLLSRRPEGWGIGLAMFLLLALGNTAALLLDSYDQDYSGALRLAQMAAYPWLIALANRINYPLAQSTTKGVAEQVPERRRFTIDPKAVQEFLKLVAMQEPEKVLREIPSAVAHLMVADFCLLALPLDESNQVNIPLVYNLIEEKYLEGFAVEGRLLPAITAALRRDRVLRLPSSSTAADLETLAHYINMSKLGPLMVVPVLGKQDQVQFGLLLVSPYSNRTWSAEDQSVLEKLAAFLRQVINGAPAADSAEGEQSDLQERLEKVQQFANEMEAENQKLTTQVEVVQSQAAQERARAESLAALIARQDSAESSQLDRLPASETVPLDNYRYLEGELRQALEQAAELKLEIAALMQQSADHADIPALKASDLDQVAEVFTLAQELRQPLASISGYTDVLLDDAMSAPGSQQRKLIERVKASVERMISLVDDLNQLTGLGRGARRLSPESIDINDVIDDAIASAMAPLREKNLLLRVDITDDLPVFYADRNALHEVLTCLIQNAGICTSVDGEISLRARAEIKENEPGYILIQVSDTGAGIPAEELPHVFSSVYRLRRKEIPGVGVTAESLAQVKVIVEAHGGRVWVDSIVGQGSTFSTLFPLAEEGLGVR